MLVELNLNSFDFRHKELLGDFPYSIKKCFVWFDKSENLIAIGVLGLNIYHPYNDYIKISVRENHRNKGIGTELFEHIKKHTKKSLQYNCMENDVASIKFLYKQGFKLKRRCWEYKFSNTDIIAGNFLEIVSLNKVEINGFKLLVLEQYIKIHEDINPFNKKFDFNESTDILFKNVDYGISMVYYSNDERYYLLVEIEEDEAIITYVGGIGKNYISFLKTALFKLSQKFSVISVEIDDVNPYAMKLKDLILLKEPMSYNTYIK